MAMAAGQAAIAFVIAALIGRYVVRPLFHVLASAEVEEVFTMTAVLIVVAASVATGSVGLSLTLGAFLAGMAIADSPYRHSIQMEVAPFRGLLLSFFFLNVGLMIDVRSLVENLPVVIAIAVGIMLIKTALLFVTARINKWTTPGATQLAFLLAQASEFTLVVLSITTIRIGTPGDGVSILIAATALSLGLAPAWSGLGMRLSQVIAARQTHRQGRHEGELAITSTARKPKVVVFGMTDSGRIMLDALIHLDIPYVALDTDARRFVRALADGYDVTYGDSSDFRILDTMDAMHAPVLLLGESRFEVSEQMTDAVREQFPKLTRFVAVNTPDDRARHRALGMRPRVIKNFMDSVALAGEVLTELEVPEEQIAQWTNTMIERHERDYLSEDEPETETDSETAA
jgi:CPA2 family monovalent cation:H+ antiporter-2